MTLFSKNATKHYYCEFLSLMSLNEMLLIHVFVVVQTRLNNKHKPKSDLLIANRTLEPPKRYSNSMLDRQGHTRRQLRRRKKGFG